MSLRSDDIPTGKTARYNVSFDGIDWARRGKDLVNRVILWK